MDGLAGETQSWLVAAKELAPSLKESGFLNFFYLITLLSPVVKITPKVLKSSQR